MAKTKRKLQNKSKINAKRKTLKTQRAQKRKRRRDHAGDVYTML